MRLLVWGYTALLVYGSLYPFSGWTLPPAPLFSFLSTWPHTLEKTDVILNVLIYAPLGLLITYRLTRSVHFGSALLAATATGTFLSFVIECIQQLIPGRVASLSDLAMNMTGALLGGTVAAFLTRGTISGAKVAALRGRWFHTGTLPNIGLITLALWTLAQTSPLVPSLDVSHLRHGVALFLHALQSPQRLSFYETFSYAFYIAGLGLLAITIGQRGKPVLLLFSGYVICVLISKMLIESRQLSPETLAGAVIAFALLSLMRYISQKAMINILGIMLITAGLVLYELAPVRDFPTYAFNWAPFGGQMISLNGLQSILDIFWPLFAIAFFTRTVTPLHWQYRNAFSGGVIVLITVFLLEWAQQYLPGRHGDITQVMLGVLGWVIPWCVHAEYHAQDRVAFAPTDGSGR
ncbi:MAG: VanZ family protein [Pseudomonadota bacterium]